VCKTLNYSYIFQTYKHVFNNIHHTNYAAVIMSVTSIVILYLVKFQVNRRFKLRMPIPIDLIVVRSLCCILTLLIVFAM